MKRIGYLSLACLAAFVIAGSIASSAFATPTPVGAVVQERAFNDCPISTVTSVNNYPASISISDTWSPFCVGWANGHAWKFSTDGINPADMGNNGNYKFGATVTLSRQSGTIEGGIHISPWWGPWMDGRFQARLPDGEVACFGGRLPFYTFTGNHGLVYTGGPIYMEIEYHANGLSAGSPASIVYRCTYGPNSYSSPVLLFDMANPAEDPPHGLWGALDPSYAGGLVQVNNGSGGSNYNATWENINFTCLDCATPAQSSTWGRLKSLYR